MQSFKASSQWLLQNIFKLRPGLITFTTPTVSQAAVILVWTITVAFCSCFLPSLSESVLGSSQGDSEYVPLLLRALRGLPFPSCSKYNPKLPTCPSPSALVLIHLLVLIFRPLPGPLYLFQGQWLPHVSLSHQTCSRLRAFALVTQFCFMLYKS